MVKYIGFCRPLRKKVEFEVSDVISYDTARGVKWGIKGKYNNYNIHTYCSKEKASKLLQELPLSFDAEISYVKPTEKTYEAEELVPFPFQHLQLEEINHHQSDLKEAELPQLLPKHYKKDGSLDMRYGVCRKIIAQQKEAEASISEQSNLSLTYASEELVPLPLFHNTEEEVTLIDEVYEGEGLIPFPVVQPSHQNFTYSFGIKNAESEILEKFNSSPTGGEIPYLQNAEAGVETLEERENEFVTITIPKSRYYNLIFDLPEVIEVSDAKMIGEIDIKFNYVVYPDLENFLLNSPPSETTFEVEFEDWANQENLTHGTNISFKRWAKEEEKKHDNPEFLDWAQHEEESHLRRYGAEITPHRLEKLRKKFIDIKGKIETIDRCESCGQNITISTIFTPEKEILYTYYECPCGHIELWGAESNGEEFKFTGLEAEMVYRTYKGRKGPSLSATSVKQGTQRKGNDGKIWEVRKAGKSQRWYRLPRQLSAEDFDIPRFFREVKIEWETDGEDVDLPTVVTVPRGLKEEEIADWISDKYGWLVSSITLLNAENIVNPYIKLAEGIGGKFVVINDRGFNISFPNGYEVSVKFGSGNYSDNYDLSGVPNNSPLYSSTAEIAILDENDALIALSSSENDTVIGWVTPEYLSPILNAASRGDKKKLQKIIKQIRETQNERNLESEEGGYNLTLKEKRHLSLEKLALKGGIVEEFMAFSKGKISEKELLTSVGKKIQYEEDKTKRGALRTFVQELSFYGKLGFGAEFSFISKSTAGKESSAENWRRLNNNIVAIFHEYNLRPFYDYEILRIYQDKDGVERLDTKNWHLTRILTGPNFYRGRTGEYYYVGAGGLDKIEVINKYGAELLPSQSTVNSAFSNKRL